MFNLIKNDFLNERKCKYEDEFHNTAFMRWDENGITAKIRFAKKDVTADAMFIPFPQEEGKEGDNITVHYNDASVLERKDVKGGLDGLTALINYWINMVLDIKFMEVNDSIIKKSNPEISNEDIATYKATRIMQYKEIAEVGKALFS